ncbi:MAG TPA: c-type cytochrome [Ferruginibacter sp.]|nr:c-type cytochrome [Ferruginibacter sp.]
MKKNHFRLSVSLILFLAIFSLFLSCNNTEEKRTPTTTGNEDSVKKMEDRGKYLANYVSLCMDCHSHRDFSQFSGPIREGTEGMGGEVFNDKLGVPGVVYAKNITPDTANGIGNWTDEEVARAITRGIRRNGDTLFPMMPYPHYNMLSKADVYSIIAYIRTLKPSNNKVPERKLMIPVSMAYPPLRSASLDNNVRPDVSDMVKYGEYVANSAACMDCHTPMEKGQFVMPKYMAGGRLLDLEIFKVNTSNITPDSATGIGKWTEEVFLDKFKVYRDKAAYASNPGKANSIMPWTLYAQMDDFDIKAIYRYLRTIPPVNNLVEKYPK